MKQIENKEITYSQEELSTVAKSYNAKLQREIDLNVNKDLVIFHLNQKIRELTAQNNELRKAKTETIVTEKQKINDIL